MSKQVAEIFKALSDETRLNIIRHLIGKKELSCQKILSNFSLSQPTLSHHFNKLIRANILNERKEGVSHFYSINHQYLKKLGLDIQKITSQNIN